MAAVVRSSAADGVYSSVPVDRVVGAQVPVSPEDAELRQKWDALQLTPDPVGIEDIRFMMTSKLAFSIALFKNSTGQGQDRHALRNIDGVVCMKMPGVGIDSDTIRAVADFGYALI